jgi:hypothetical protein
MKPRWRAPKLGSECTFERPLLADVCPSRRVASGSGHKPNDPKVSTEGGIHEPRVPGSRAPGLAGLRAFRVAGFGALRVAGLRVESVAGLIGIRMK